MSSRKTSTRREIETFNTVKTSHRGGRRHLGEGSYECGERDLFNKYSCMWCSYAVLVIVDNKLRNVVSVVYFLSALWSKFRRFLQNIKENIWDWLKRPKEAWGVSTKSRVNKVILRHNKDLDAVKLGGFRQIWIHRQLTRWAFVQFWRNGGENQY